MAVRGDLSWPLGEILVPLTIEHRGCSPVHPPGRPITSERLGLRLRAYGINARAARASLLLDLAAEVAPGFLTDLLGMQPGTAVRWVRAAGW